jgi:16S rRNA (uracil1498-N3)-methyltransferase
MSSHRFLFYAPDARAGDDTIELTGDEHRHLSRVLRISCGELVHATDGHGLLAECTVERIGEGETTLAVVAAEVAEALLPVTLALALLKKDRFAQALEQCAELGVTRCLPFVAEKSHVRTYGEGTLGRLRRIAVTAMKQSFSPWLMEVADPVDLEGVLIHARGAETVILGEQGAPPVPTDTSGGAVVLVGPEAGLSDTELEAVRGIGAIAASVSRRRLRSETAAVALVAALLRGD